MTDMLPPLIEQRRSNWVRLRTLIVLRWIAIGGQLAAIFVAQAAFDITLDVGLCYLAVGAAVIANLVAIFIYPENKRLSEEAMLLMLVFDITQLGFLLFLTGGLNNPFAMLMIAPVTISATTLQLRSTFASGLQRRRWSPSSPLFTSRSGRVMARRSNFPQRSFLASGRPS
jgi:two-component system, sensor histidine kinase RegB